MSKTYMYCLIIIGVYLLIISPLNSKKEEKKENSKEEKKEDNSNSNEKGTNKTPLQRRFPNFNTNNNVLERETIQDEVDKITTNPFEKSYTI